MSEIHVSCRGHFDILGGCEVCSCRDPCLAETLTARKNMFMDGEFGKFKELHKDLLKKLSVIATDFEVCSCCGAFYKKDEGHRCGAKWRR